MCKRNTIAYFFPSSKRIQVFLFFFFLLLGSSAFLPQRHFWFWKGEILNYGEFGWRSYAIINPTHWTFNGLSWSRFPKTRQFLREWSWACHDQWAPRSKSTVSLKSMTNEMECTLTYSYPPFSLTPKLSLLLLNKHLKMYHVTKYGKGLREVKCTSTKRTGEHIIVYT